MKKIAKEISIFTGVFSLLFVLSFSFPFSILPNIGGWLEPMFNKIVIWEGQEMYHSGEDSIGMVCNFFNVLIVSVTIYGLLAFKLSEDHKSEFSVYSVTWIRYYLAIILLIYGFDKVYKWQFYSPESNILYTRVKDLPQDMLYWTTMGTSYSYSMFGGILEVLAGGLLLFRKSYVIGSLLSLGVLTNVFAVNIGFDITIKIFSGFLLFLSCVLLFPFIEDLVSFFRGKVTQLNQTVPTYSKRRFYLPVKVLVLLLILIETQYKYVGTGNFNDDLAVRHHLNGVYEVIEGDEKIERIHFHRQGYFILETFNDEFIDFKLQVHDDSQEFLLIDYSKQQQIMRYRENGDTLWISSPDGTFSLVTLKQKL